MTAVDVFWSWCMVAAMAAYGSTTWLSATSATAARRSRVRSFTWRRTTPSASHRQFVSRARTSLAMERAPYPRRSPYRMGLAVIPKTSTSWRTWRRPCRTASLDEAAYIFIPSLPPCLLCNCHQLHIPERLANEI